MGKPLSLAQEKLRDEQILNNINHLEKIDLLLVEIDPFIDESNRYNNYLQEVYDKLNGAHGMLMQGEYANLYTKHFRKTSTPALDFYNSISDEFAILTEEQKEKFLEGLPELDKYSGKIDLLFKRILPLFDDAFAENSIIMRFEGMEQIYLELKKLSSEHWKYPSELAVKEVLHNREFIQPLIFHGIPRAHPFHIEVYISYSTKFNTSFLLKSKLQRLRTLIKSINAQLPFAELNHSVPHIQNIVNGIDKSTSVGENANIGDNNAIGDSASVEGG